MDLTVHFEGLCHFVPFYRDFPADDVNLDKMWVILVNGRNTLEVPFSVRGQINPAEQHYAFVRVASGSISPDQPADLLGLWPIHGADLEILDLDDNPLAPGSLTLKRVVPQNPREPQTAAEESSYHWVADLGEAEGRHTRILADCLEEIELDQVPTTLAAARIRLEAGEVSTGFVVRDRNADGRPPIVFKMTGGQQEFSRALAEQISWAVTVPTDGIVLVRKNRLTGAQDRLTLQAKNDRLELLIGNLEASSLLGQKDHRDFEARISEFLWFYGLSPNKLQAGVTFPVPEAEEKPKDGDPYCPVSGSRQP